MSFMTDEDKSTIIRAAHSFHRRVKSSYEMYDLIQEGFIVWLRCQQTFDPDKGLFSGYLYTALRRHYYSITKNERKLKTTPIERMEDFQVENLLPSNEYPIIPIGLSEPCRQFIAIASNPPEELLERAKENPYTPFPKTICKYLGVKYTPIVHELMML